MRGWIEGRHSRDLYLCTVTLAEIRFGIDRLDDPERRALLLAWLDDVLRPWFLGRVLPIDEDVILVWRWMVHRGRERGHTFSQPDLFLAATAEAHGLVLVTRNVHDFRDTGVPLLNPWA